MLMYRELHRLLADIVMSAEARSELCLDGAILVVTQHWLNFVYSSIEI